MRRARCVLSGSSYPSLWRSRRSPHTQFLVPISSASLWASISSSSAVSSRGALAYRKNSEENSELPLARPFCILCRAVSTSWLSMSALRQSAAAISSAVG